VGQLTERGGVAVDRGWRGEGGARRGEGQEGGEPRSTPGRCCRMFAVCCTGAGSRRNAIKVAVHGPCILAETIPDRGQTSHKAHNFCAFTHTHTRAHTHRRLPAFVATASSRRTEGMLERGIGAEGWRGNKRTTNLFCLLLRARLKINEVGVEGAINDGGNSCRVV